jgi:uncharacterized membrane protein YgdD (TMEM256/DUF423 family)
MWWMRAAALFGLLGVALGAFAAHGLRGRIAEPLLSAFQTGVLYHLLHTVALLALALYARATGAAITLPAALFSAGIVLFSGSLYAMALSGVHKLGAITPVGGLAFLAGWLSLLFLAKS